MGYTFFMPQLFLEPLYRENKIKEVLKLLENSLNTDTDTFSISMMLESMRLLVEHLVFLGDIQHALSYFNRIKKLAKPPHTLEVDAVISELKVKLLREGIVHLDIKEEGRMIESKVHKAYGDHLARYSYALMVLNIIQGKLERAEQYYMSSLQIQDISTDIIWYTRREYGLLLTLKGQVNKAIQHYVQLRSLAINIMEKIRINRELYMLTHDAEYLNEAKKDILILLMNLPDGLKKAFVNKTWIKNILKA